MLRSTTPHDRPSPVRRCARPDCSETAVTTLAFDYDTRQVWIDRLSAEASPATHDLCALHAERFVPPQGWNGIDRRHVAPLFPEPAPEARAAS